MQRSRHRSEELTSTECNTSPHATRHRREESTSKNSGATCHNPIADFKGEELTSPTADEAQLTSASLLQADVTIDDKTAAYTDTDKTALHTPHLSDIHSTYSIALLHPHRRWPICPECLLHLYLCLHFYLHFFHYMYHSGGRIRPLQLNNHKFSHLILALVCHLAHPLHLRGFGSIDYHKSILHTYNLIVLVHKATFA